MKFTLLTSLVFVLSLHQSWGAFTTELQFSTLFDGNVLSGIADEDGVVTNGLSWGILVGAPGSDFSTPLVTELGLSTVDGEELASGLRFFSGGVTAEVPPFADDGPANGAVLSANFDFTGFTPNVGMSDEFALIWFGNGITSGDTLEVGANYGILTNPVFVLEGDGVLDRNSPFAGPEGPFAANLVVQGVPEPSAALLGLIGVLGMLRRRR